MRDVYEMVPYTWRHPIKRMKWLRRNKRQRIRQGFCDADVWNMDRWFLAVVPAMLRVLSNDIAFPDQEFGSLEEWQDWLVSLAEAFESCTREAIEDQNQYADDPKDTRYFDRQLELETQAEKRVQDAMTEMGKHFMSLWS